MCEYPSHRGLCERDRRRWADSSRTTVVGARTVLASPAVQMAGLADDALEESSWDRIFCAGPSRDFRHRNAAHVVAPFRILTEFDQRAMVMPGVRSRPFRKEVCLHGSFSDG